MENEPHLTTGVDPSLDGLRLDPKTEAGAKFAADLSKLIEHDIDEDIAIKLLSSATGPYTLMIDEKGAVELVLDNMNNMNKLNEETS